MKLTTTNFSGLTIGDIISIYNNSKPYMVTRITPFVLDVYPLDSLTAWFTKRKLEGYFLPKII